MGDSNMEDKEQIKETLLEILGEKGCGVVCEDNVDILYDEEEGWKLKLCGFMEPWKLGKKVDEAKAALYELGSIHFGM
jgi:hypothetical protein